MENNTAIHAAVKTDWFCEEFIYNSVVKFLKDNGYKVHKENHPKENTKPDRIITATKFFKKEVIEVKGYPHYHDPAAEHLPAKSTSPKSWFYRSAF